MIGQFLPAGQRRILEVSEVAGRYASPALCRGKTQSKGFTLIELLVVIAITATLMAILMPALSLAREQGRRTVCMANVRRLAVSLKMYADTNDDRFPPRSPAVHRVCHGRPVPADEPPMDMVSQ